MILSGILLTSDKQKIAYEHYCNKHDKVVIIVHGFYNSKDAVILKDLARALSADYDVFMFDFRGHGKSGGLFTWTSKEDKDFKAVLEYLGPKYTRIGVVSFSMGASVCINVASQDKRVNTLVAVAPVSDVKKIDYQFWKLDKKGDLKYTLFTKEGRKGRGFRPGPFWYKKKKPIESVGTLTIPVLYIHGDKDWVIKPWHSRALFEKTNSKKKLVIIKGGPHAEYLVRDDFKAVAGEMRAWLKDTL